ncbi:MMS19 nucleotide excision repair protein homolog isoform X1 [Juglans microcarpa x Juglans regia]|uniref:MMS19 nucleotide excision repair protein homolog isoform X1 n=2 Tax=Juglans microcarpa x Juglans regia TaxID=2249226 RepID=UPI001B7E5F14|nr:MMS19 nucleotide excision repair protein homolog isoform X1 [Juglans microcarpa x Juglans regia]
MAESSRLGQSIDSFVDSSCSLTQQAASLDTITSLVKNGVLSVEGLVREMEMYLTTTDNIIRARGILLLGEVLACLVSKPLENATIHSLIGFFTDRLADWKCLRGALVGCLALMRRKLDAGMVTDTDAKAVAHSFLQNLQVQSLGQHDRKLCFELLECLLECYPDSVAPLGDELVYGICEAVDSEKDPQCLMLTFRIIELLARLFPDQSGPLASFAGDLFEILGCYFPIHFTHPKAEDLGIKRDDLSEALMLAFSSTPFFEPFAIPLLLEKLSSSLPFAKVDSLKYLSSCTLKYGAERMLKHAGAIWLAIKDAIYNSIQEPALSFTSESLVGLGFQENEIAKEALTLLQRVIVQSDSLYLSLIVKDEDINMILNTITSYESYNDIYSQGRLKLHVVGRFLSISARSSIASCNRVFESFFPRLMEILGLPVKNLSGDHSPIVSSLISKRLNFGALYLCIELLASYRDLTAGSKEIASKSISASETCYCMLQSYSNLLTKAFCSTLVTSPQDADIYFGVKGLQILATFPGYVSPMLISEFESILITFMSIITLHFKKTLLWKLSLKALVNIGSFIDEYHESEKVSSYMGVVVEKIISLVSLDDFTMPFPLKLEAISGIGASGLNYMLKIVRGLEEAIYTNLSEFYAHENMKSPEITIRLLECYSNKVLPRIHENGSFDEVLLRFPVNVWSQIESHVDFSIQVQEMELLDATMTAMRHAVAFCSVESQNKIIQKAYSVLSSSTFFPLKEFTSLTIQFQLGGLQLAQKIDNLSYRDEWILSLFASVVIAARPQTPIPNLKEILQLFMTTLLKGSVPAAQALGSIVNKLGKESNELKISSDCTLEEALETIFQTKLWNSHDNGALMKSSGTNNGSEMSFADSCLGMVNNNLPQIHAIAGLSWIGKGLLLRGHEKVKDVTMIFLEFLLENNKADAFPLKQNSLESSSERDLHPSVIKSAADAFHILMSDSEVCLNRKFHAVIRPLYKQRFFSTMMPILQPLIMKNDSSLSRSMLCRAFAHIISDTPLTPILSEAKKLIPIILDCLSMLNKDIQDKDILYSLLLVLSGILTDKNGQEAVIENVHHVINNLTKLIAYPHMMLVRETAIQCLVAMSELPHARIYPMRIQVLRAISNALNDPKRAIRQEAVRCRQAWASIASRSLHF